MNSDGLEGAAWPSRYSSLRSGKLTPTQMIFSGAGIGISKRISASEKSGASAPASSASRVKAPSATTSRSVGHFEP
ncbi:hypothetical protein D3C71_1689810 [compost metagenome]